MKNNSFIIVFWLSFHSLCHQKPLPITKKKEKKKKKERKKETSNKDRNIEKTQ